MDVIVTKLIMVVPSLAPPQHPIPHVGEVKETANLSRILLLFPVAGEAPTIQNVSGIVRLVQQPFRIGEKVEVGYLEPLGTKKMRLHFFKNAPQPASFYGNQLRYANRPHVSYTPHRFPP